MAAPGLCLGIFRQRSKYGRTWEERGEGRERRRRGKGREKGEEGGGGGRGEKRGKEGGGRKGGGKGERKDIDEHHSRIRSKYLLICGCRCGQSRCSRRRGDWRGCGPALTGRSQEQLEQNQQQF